ncbi:hypothetical protein GUITHDRAFT_102992 [Guillardia theta CCMP2712]|uniref:C3H1-type domain-containing protein n=1 Tax=Guillardia theta (strain CCMP2712) TaxID=905079 RepID=L1JSA1_GUITC|nr:hypothetical protein GUITHDRAFT_102992 [Guillardia theta CCMP2712]EKX51070.1 hypothetical protein GUITHDRAFT_102992 [Guillardia theta CCMP2712]|eukprot:XP_005838050.1 hypothetical protein GUITHDRAFT_102992 [Guillardia theta CCMP2712]
MADSKGMEQPKFSPFACHADKNRRDGIRLLRVNGRLLCHFYMKGECPHGEKMLHLPKEERPACPNFVACGVCKFGSQCWYPHSAAARKRDMKVNLAVQVQGTHYQRMLDFFNELETCDVVETGQLAAGKKTVKVILLQVDEDPIAFAHQHFIRSERMRSAVARVYHVYKQSQDLHQVLQSGGDQHL